MNGEAVFRNTISAAAAAGPASWTNRAVWRSIPTAVSLFADTWNRRIAVFDLNGSHLDDFRVRGWYNNAFNRPYLALDETRDTLYITDPDSKRVLVYDTDGECFGSFGEAGESSAAGQFQDIGGIAVDADGYVYVSDSGAGRVLKFARFLRE